MGLTLADDMPRVTVTSGGGAGGPRTERWWDEEAQEWRTGMAATEPKELSCEDCVYALFQDTGYSSYTVEGTDFFCMKNAHPDDGFDAWYRTDKRLNFAAKCPTFEAGECVSLDVDQDEMRNLTPEQKAIYNAWEPRAE